MKSVRRFGLEGEGTRSGGWFRWSRSMLEITHRSLEVEVLEESEIDMARESCRP